MFMTAQSRRKLSRFLVSKKLMQKARRGERPLARDFRSLGLPQALNENGGADYK